MSYPPCQDWSEHADLLAAPRVRRGHADLQLRGDRGQLRARGARARVHGRAAGQLRVQGAAAGRQPGPPGGSAQANCVYVWDSEMRLLNFDIDTFGKHFDFRWR